METSNKPRVTLSQLLMKIEDQVQVEEIRNNLSSFLILPSRGTRYIDFLISCRNLKGYVCACDIRHAEDYLGYFSRNIIEKA